MAEASAYRLVLPCRAESVALSRLFVATVLRSLSHDETDVDDAKLAVSELVSAVIESGATDVEVAVTCEVASCRVDVSPLGDAARGGAVERLDVAHALFDSLDFTAATARFVVAQSNP